jgi:MotA/TolQ/ExbB proton channel family
MSYWDLLKQMGLCGLLIIVTFFWMLVSFARSYRQNRMSWRPLWLGAIGLLLGVLGTVLGTVEAYSRVAALGGAASPTDLPEGIAASLTVTAIGMGSLIAGAVMTMLLRGRFKRIPASQHEEYPEPPRDPR